MDTFSVISQMEPWNRSWVVENSVDIFLIATWSLYFEERVPVEPHLSKSSCVPCTMIAYLHMLSHLILKKSSTRLFPFLIWDSWVSEGLYYLPKISVWSERAKITTQAGGLNQSLCTFSLCKTSTHAPSSCCLFLGSWLIWNWWEVFTSSPTTPGAKEHSVINSWVLSGKQSPSFPVEKRRIIFFSPLSGIYKL